MCFRLGVNWLIVFWMKVGLFCLEFFGISDFFLLNVLSVEFFWLLLVDKVDFWKEKVGVLRKFLFLIGDGVIEECFFIVGGILSIIVDFFWGLW